MRPFLALLKS